MPNPVTNQLPGPFFPLSVKDILARIGNQASRPPLRSPPFIQPSSVVAALKQQGPQHSQAKTGPMSKAIPQKITRMEIHGIYDDSAGKSPLKQAIANGTPLWLACPFNPASLEHSIKANWPELAPPGLSYKRMHYTGTDNQIFKFDLLLDYMVEVNAAQPTGAPVQPAPSAPGVFPDAYVNKVADAYAFIQSLHYPKALAQGPSNFHPPEVLLYWPNALSLHCVLMEMTARWEKMLPTGHLASVMCSLTFKEIPHEAITLEDVRVKGTLRTPAQPGSSTSAPAASSGAGTSDLAD